MQRVKIWKFMKSGRSKIPWIYIDIKEWGLGFCICYNRAFHGIRIKFLCFETVLGNYSN